MVLMGAQRLAEQLLSELAPVCERVELAGSIRRGKASVKDIELVAIPKRTVERVMVGLFSEEREFERNHLHDWACNEGRALVQWIKPGTSDIVSWEPRADARYLRGLVSGGNTFVSQAAQLREGGIKLDLFLTTRERWGATMLIRTGSADFSHAVAAHAQRVNRRFDGGALTIAGVTVETFEEEDVFALLGLEYVAPSCRVDGSQLALTVEGVQAMQTLRRSRETAAALERADGKSQEAFTADITQGRL